MVPWPAIMSAWFEDGIITAPGPSDVRTSSAVLILDWNGMEHGHGTYPDLVYFRLHSVAAEVAQDKCTPVRYSHRR